MPTVQAGQVTSPLLTDVTLAPAWRSTLAVDLDDPFFFDHPLDHVPGMMLISALLELVRTSTPEPSGGTRRPGLRRLATVLWFPRFCELDEPTELGACPPSGAGGWAVQASQSRGPVCLGSVAIDETGPQLPSGPSWDRRSNGGPEAPELSPEAADASFVHRARPENILVSRISPQDGGARRVAVLGSSDEAHFTRRTGAMRSPEELLEAARQVATMVWPCEYGWPADVLLTLNRVQAELPVALDRSRSLELRWRPSQPRGTKARIRLELVDATAEPQRVGLVTIESQAWTREEWQRLRAGQR
ncbi:MAG TPA: AfsA-related hotdog domain-containing protein [Micromonosporaceae bacterium]|nr:AfsA-related hotdog domain-containing protein [Micromonosporaceae bacterium]